MQAASGWFDGNDRPHLCIACLSARAETALHPLKPDGVPALTC